jgi:hypothetical protein
MVSIKLPHVSVHFETALMAPGLFKSSGSANKIIYE